VWAPIDDPGVLENEAISKNIIFKTYMIAHAALMAPSAWATGLHKMSG
jgi:hypothetical protein